jgi:dolichol-phosphate hexosyltransferase
MELLSDGMAFSEEIKIEALRNRVRFEEISIQYSSRLGEIKLNPWRDGLYNLWFLLRKRFRVHRHLFDEAPPRVKPGGGA